MTVKLSLNVNGALIDTDYFVEDFIDHTVSGMVESLKGTSEIKDLNLAIDGDEVTVNLNGDMVTLNAFASKILKSTIIGMVSPLKGVDNVRTLNIVLNK